jgi:hypothetical protein
LDKILGKHDALNTKSKQVARVKPPVKKGDEKTEVSAKVTNTRWSVDLEKSDESSLYVSALEILPEENIKRLSRTQKVRLIKGLSIYEVIMKGLKF